MDNVETIALLMGVAWASGINLYAAVLVLGLLNASGYMTLPNDLMILSDPLVLIAAGFMYCVEFFADKTPGVDSGWDAIHTFVRIPAGAVLAAATVGDVHPGLEFAAFMLGGSVAAGAHVTKAGSRVMINTSPEPVSNWFASVSEDVLVIAGLWTALAHPWVFLVALAVFVLFAIWLLPKVWRGVKRVYGGLYRRLRGSSDGTDPSSAELDIVEPQSRLDL